MLWSRVMPSFSLQQMPQKAWKTLLSSYPVVSLYSHRLSVSPSSALKSPEFLVSPWKEVIQSSGVRYIQFLLSHCTGCVTLGKLVNLSEMQFP